MMTGVKKILRHPAFWSGVVTIVFTALMILWLKRVEVHGSRILDVTRTVSGRYQIAGLFVLYYIGGTVIPVPLDPVFTLALTISKTPAFVTVLVALFGSTLGSLTNFYLARALGHDWVARQAGHRSARAFLKWFDRFGPAALVIFGILPLPVFDVLTLFAGLSNMGAGRFLIYALIGRSIHLLALALIAMKVLVL